MSDHARLAPSAMKRIIACPGCVRMSEGIPEESSFFAMQGTAAHLLLEHCMLLGVEPHTYLGHTYVVPTKQGGQMRFTVDEDMADAVAHALDFVTSYITRYPEAHVMTERRVYPGHAINRADCWGTMDLSITNLPVEIVVLDYKHGAGIYVEVEDNEQLMTYALGVLYEIPRVFDRFPNMPVRLIIVQPRNRGTSGPVREHVVTVRDIFRFAGVIASAAKESDKPDARLHAGDHCRFCRALPRCDTAAEHAMAMAKEQFNDESGTRLIDPSSERFAYLLRQVPFVTQWAKAVEAEGLRHAESGGTVPEHKLVRGRNSRNWTDPDAAVLSLDLAGVPEDVYAPRSFVSPAQAEELLKARKVWKIYKPTLSPLIRKTPGGLKLVHNSDPRPPAGPLDQFDIEDPLLS